ncbi:UNVERIFIED_CONTAM: hypothetical protein Sradi_5238600 [Sesamum radiatum]|uniref:Uncharacterized protein n=1 Tax=Sesamum radiatum TaxID=300843 RepID=A0AAW2LL82_SESRA
MKHGTHPMNATLSASLNMTLDPHSRGPRLGTFQTQPLAVDFMTAIQCAVQLLHGCSIWSVGFVVMFKQNLLDHLFQQREDLAPKETTLMGFEGSTIRALGEIILPISLGEEPRIKTVMANFLVLDTSYPRYNIILGRPTLNAIGVVISTSCLKMKFPTKYGIGEVHGNQRSARECRCHTLRKMRKDEDGPLNFEGRMNPINESRVSH